MAKTCPVCGTSYEDSSVFCPKDGTTLRADESAGDLVGSVIADRYRITKLLGEGGMGRVYLAEHVRLPQKAAIKVLHPGMVKDGDAVARFNREAANAAKIEHDRVARVFDFGETRDGLVYLAMEFVPGRTIRSLMTEEGTLTPTRAASLTYQIAEGLDAAHRIGIVHRDLKPDNIIVMTDDQGVDRSKVVDFGIAKAVGGTETQLTRTGMVVGTPEFMSPEQVLGESLDARSDVYALALVTYQMLTGMLPFSSSTPERSLTARLIEDPRPLAVAAPETAWPADLQAAIDRALAREPDQRTGSALEFAEALVSATESWTGASVLRPRTPLSTASITAAANALRTSTVTPPSSTAAPSPMSSAKPTSPTAPSASPNTRAEQPTARSKTPLLAGAAVAVAAAIGIFLMTRGDGTKTAASTGDGAISTASTPNVQPAASNASPPDGAVQTNARSPQSSTPQASASSPPVGGRVGSSSTIAGTSTPVVPPEASRGVAAATVNDAAQEAAADAKRMLTAIRKEIEDVSEASAALIGAEDATKLRALLPDLNSRADSVLTYYTLAIANSMADRTELACVALRNARQLAATPAQRDMIRQLSAAEAFASCKP